MIRSTLFTQLGGLNESQSEKGQMGAIAVDCDLGARVWLEGYAVVYIMPGVTKSCPVPYPHDEEDRSFFVNIPDHIDQLDAAYNKIADLQDAFIAEETNMAPQVARLRHPPKRV